MAITCGSTAALRRKSRVGQVALVIGLSAACIAAPLLAWGCHLRHNAVLAIKQAESLTPRIAEVNVCLWWPAWPKHLQGAPQIV
jgi:hypothetical protein